LRSEYGTLAKTGRRERRDKAKEIESRRFYTGGRRGDDMYLWRGVGGPSFKPRLPVYGQKLRRDGGFRCTEGDGLYQGPGRKKA